MKESKTIREAIARKIDRMNSDDLIALVILVGVFSVMALAVIASAVG